MTPVLIPPVADFLSRLAKPDTLAAIPVNRLQWRTPEVQVPARPGSIIPKAATKAATLAVVLVVFADDGLDVVLSSYCEVIRHVDWLACFAVGERTWGRAAHRPQDWLNLALVMQDEAARVPRFDAVDRWADAAGLRLSEYGCGCLGRIAARLFARAADDLAAGRLRP